MNEYLLQAQALWEQTVYSLNIVVYGVAALLSAAVGMVAWQTAKLGWTVGSTVTRRCLWPAAKFTAWPVTASVRAIRNAYHVDPTAKLILDALAAGPVRVDGTDLVVGPANKLRFKGMNLGAKSSLCEIHCAGQRVDNQLNGSREKVISRAIGYWNVFRDAAAAEERRLTDSMMLEHVRDSLAAKA